MMKKLVVAIVIVLVIAGAGYAILGRSGGQKTLGQAIPDGMKAVTVAQALEHARIHPGMQVLLTGTMDEKCPTAGCWFYLSDGTGRIRVDTQFAGFTVLEQKTGSKVTVYGKLTQPEEGEPEISALGARF
jgi:uncharacterized protein YdeI (BOF family)